LARTRCFEVLGNTIVSERGAASSSASKDSVISDRDDDGVYFQYAPPDWGAACVNAGPKQLSAGSASEPGQAPPAAKRGSSFAHHGKEREAAARPDFAGVQGARRGGCPRRAGFRRGAAGLSAGSTAAGLADVGKRRVSCSAAGVREDRRLEPVPKDRELSPLSRRKGAPIRERKWASTTLWQQGLTPAHAQFEGALRMVRIHLASPPRRLPSRNASGGPERTGRLTQVFLLPAFERAAPGQTDGSSVAPPRVSQRVMTWSLGHAPRAVVGESLLEKQSSESQSQQGGS